MSNHSRDTRRGVHVLAVHVVGVLLVIGIMGSSPFRQGEVFGMFRHIFRATYGNLKPAPTYTVKTKGSVLNTAAPGDTTTARDPVNNPPPPPKP